MILVVILLAAAAAGWFLARDDSKPVSLAQRCPSPSPSSAASPSAAPAALPAPRQVRLVLLNGTPRNGLASQVGSALAARGFVVLSHGNAPAAVAGPAVVTYGPGAAPAATVLARHVHGARLVAAPRARAGSVQLVLGGDFRRLSTPGEVAAATPTATGGAVVGPAPTQSPCVS
jgi:hypothetical protein